MSVKSQDLQEALRVAAILVDLDGDIYLPTFLRIEAELKNRDAARSAVERARTLARKAG
ncbi:hypothetical protein [Roseobacter weihaiensis]|uniref:hypothetical protein n=1 Tax=Roseobacter weihaiensis TaxID=2763262 RepID=UPI001D0BDB1E|nr:hypothetical protein [Roseobacter sp. H9]